MILLSIETNLLNKLNSGRLCLVKQLLETEQE